MKHFAAHCSRQKYIVRKLHRDKRDRCLQLICIKGVHFKVMYILQMRSSEFPPVFVSKTKSLNTHVMTSINALKTMALQSASRNKTSPETIFSSTIIRTNRGSFTFDASNFEDSLQFVNFSQRRMQRPEESRRTGNKANKVMRLKRADTNRRCT